MRTRALFCLLPIAYACHSESPQPTTTPDPTNPTGSEVGSGGNAASAGGDAGSPSTGAVSPEAAPYQTPEVVPFVDADINHVLFTGQSNSVANSGTPVLSSTQPYANLMFNTGVIPATGCDGQGCKAYDPPTSFVPLVEGDSFFNYQVETPCAGMANEITLLAQPRPHNVLVTLHGRSGNTYWCLRKNGCNYKPGYLHPFEQAMMEVQSAKDLAAAQGKSYLVRAVMSVHGESDHYSSVAGSAEYPLDGTDGTPAKIKNYADALIEWQADYAASVTAITGQTVPVPMFISQISGWNDTPISLLAQDQLDAHVRSNGAVNLVTPAYALPMDQEDCRHYTNDGERRLGEYFAKAYQKVVVERQRWEPLRPTEVKRAGLVITAKFHVPVPPLVVDTQRVAAIDNLGFTVSNASITKTEVVGDSVLITLDHEPQGETRLRYAQNQTPQTCIGTPYGARGNLRDSDATKSQHGYELHNWAVVFDVPVL